MMFLSAVANAAGERQGVAVPGSESGVGRVPHGPRAPHPGAAPAHRAPHPARQVAAVHADQPPRLHPRQTVRPLHHGIAGGQDRTQG